MFFYHLTIKYDGSNYFGWQIQPEQKTIQGELNRCLLKITKGDHVHTIGSGRTDAKVHAFAQHVRVEIDLKIGPESLKKALNSHLPNDIEVLNVLDSDSDFHPVFQATQKEYQYLFTTVHRPPPHLRHLITYCPYRIDLELAKKAASEMIGTFDFHNFQTVGTEVKTTIRKIDEIAIELIKVDSFWRNPFFESYWSITVKGEGFLKQMVRLMVGAIWSVGRGQSGLDLLSHALSSKEKLRIGIVAPPEGLYLKHVTY